MQMARILYPTIHGTEASYFTVNREQMVIPMENGLVFLDETLVLFPLHI